MLTPTGELMAAAAARSRGVGAFNVIMLEHAESLVAGAEAAGAPVILQISQNAVRYHGALEPLALATLAVARAAATPVAVHLDHATDVDLVHRAVALGFGSVMYDASPMSYVDNVAATAKVADYCHDHGVFVEAELGEVGGKDGVHSPGARTDPAEARDYAAATGVDALAVAVGTSHAMLTRDAAVDLELIARLRATVPVPLVLHGSSGVPDPDLTRAVEAGMTKINIGTRLNAVFTRAVRGYLADHPDIVDPRTYLRPARAAISAEVARILTVIRATN
ncbi:MAG TPA: class II fructose-bisphosphate aldolase [Actinophytocola sp.]|uniref:class II fructose-bisphosphate aldolase n=1 Tax=Actinophytocola sp. TaxID=1872138 RepID=UPI002DDD192C|nr:class II fructose-bisphosphate aldolase [Actinophytocola sp.]HEV2781581.1 class II fructose-bisphosphate aldolase [Actinophytocola sp.]